MPWIKKGIRRYMPTVNYQPDPPLSYTVKDLEGAKGIILDIGAGGRTISQNIWGVDFIAFPNTMIIADIHHLPFATGSVAAVICTGVLEHVENPFLAMGEMHRILITWRLIHIEVPFMQPYHADPIDYWRWTLPGIRKFCKASGFEEIRSGSHLRTQAAMNTILISYIKSWVNVRFFQRIIEFFMSFLLCHLNSWISSQTRKRLVCHLVFFLLARNNNLSLQKHIRYCC